MLGLKPMVAVPVTNAWPSARTVWAIVACSSTTGDCEAATGIYGHETMYVFGQRRLPAGAVPAAPSRHDWVPAAPVEFVVLPMAYVLIITSAVF